MYMTAEGAGGALPAAHSASNRHKRPAPPRAAAAPQRPAAPLRAAPRSPRTQTKWRRGLPRPGPARTTGHPKKGGRGEGSATLAGWRRERARQTERTAFRDAVSVFLVSLELYSGEGVRCSLIHLQGSPPRSWEKWFLPPGGGLGAKGKCERAAERGTAGGGRGLRGAPEGMGLRSGTKCSNRRTNKRLQYKYSKHRRGSYPNTSHTSPPKPRARFARFPVISTQFFSPGGAVSPQLWHQQLPQRRKVPVLVLFTIIKIRFKQDGLVPASPRAIARPSQPPIRGP